MPCHVFVKIGSDVEQHYRPEGVSVAQIVIAAESEDHNSIRRLGFLGRRADPALEIWTPQVAVIQMENTIPEEKVRTAFTDPRLLWELHKPGLGGAFKIIPPGMPGAVLSWPSAGASDQPQPLIIANSSSHDAPFFVLTEQ